jgi:large subunit ribosomal protein L7/L12
MKIEIELEEIADLVADRIRSQVLAMLRAAAEPPEESAGYTVLMHSAGEKKIEVIQVVRRITGLDLKGAKDLVESACNGGVVVVKGLSEDAANTIETQFEEAGAEVSVYDEG